MNPRRLFNWLIVLTVAVGLLSAPSSAPAVAKAHDAVAGEMLAAADGMPCCPGEGTTPAKDCDACPLMALCSMTMPIPAPTAASAFAPLPMAQAAFALPDDLLIDGLSARPPDHPPRNLA
ncbi:hypothetical protein [Bradyrhizobium sp.]|uniref:hypothetical protein n=1 Tax=Bradyrhizobium sp. TaxID=376 RepID=UPI004037B2F0